MEEFHETVDSKVMTPPVRWKKVVTPGPTPRPRHGHRAVSIKDLMVVFGGGNEGIIDELHVYNSATNQWFVPVLRGELPPGRAAYGIAIVHVHIYIFGGMIEYGRYSNELFVLNGQRWEWKKLQPRPPKIGGSGPCPRLGHSFTVTSNQVAYVFGGLANNSPDPKKNLPRYLNDLFSIDLKAGRSALQWKEPKTFGNRPTARESHTCVYVETSTAKQLVIYGGMNGDRRMGDVWLLNVDTLTWDNPQLLGCPPLPRSLHTANMIGERMYVYGGWVPMASDNAYDFKEWECTSTMATLNVETLTWEHVNHRLINDALVASDSGNGVTHQPLSDRLAAMEMTPGGGNAGVEAQPDARAGHSSVLVNKRLFVWSGRDGYRKAWNTEGCCEDVWFLETDKPEVPSKVSLVKSHEDKLEVKWQAAPSAEAYRLQLYKYEGADTKRMAVGGEGHDGTPVMRTPVLGGKMPLGGVVQRTSGGQLVELVRNAQHGQGSKVVRVVKGSITPSAPPPSKTPIGHSFMGKPMSATTAKPSVATPNRVVHQLAPQAAVGSRAAAVAAAASQPRPIVSTQGTTYTTPTVQPDDISLPTDLLDEMTDAPPPDPSSPSRNVQPTVGVTAAAAAAPLEGDEEPEVPMEGIEMKEEVKEEEEVKKEGGEMMEKKEKSDDQVSVTDTTTEAAASESGLKEEENESQPMPSAAPIEGDTPPTAAAAAAQGTRTVAANEQPTALPQEEGVWFDVGIIKGTSCMVTHYFISSENSLESAYNEDSSGNTVANTQIKAELEPGTYYKFRVAGINALGRGDWSDVDVFKTCTPGFPGAPSSIKITKIAEGAHLAWLPPSSSTGPISEYTVYLAVRNAVGQAPYEKQLAFMRVFVGPEPECIVTHQQLSSAYVDTSDKPAIFFRVTARGKMGYGPSTQVRWLQDTKPHSSAARTHVRYPVNSSITSSILRRK